MQRVLRKRILRDLKENRFRYLAMSLLIIMGMYIVVALVASGYTVTNQSRRMARENGLEDGAFTTFLPLTEGELRKLSRDDCVVEPMFYMDYEMENGAVIRTFKLRSNIDRLQLDQGRLPFERGDIVLEKQYAANNHYLVGDSIMISGKEFCVVGIGSTPDYDAPMKELSDAVVTSDMFGTAFLLPEDYEELRTAANAKKAEQYLYAFTLGESVSIEQFKKRLNKITIDPKDVEDVYFQQYYEEVIGDVDDMKSGVRKLNKGTEELYEALERITKNNEDMVEGSADIFDNYLKEAQSGLREVGLKETLTEENFKEVLTQLKQSCSNAIAAMSIRNVRDTLSSLKQFKDGVYEYTDAVAKTGKGAKKISEGMDDYQEGVEEALQEVDTELTNLVTFVKAEDNPRILAAASDQEITVMAGMIAGVIVMGLFAYVISVFVVHGIEKESAVIGALYALGTRKRELLCHYLMLPCILMFASGVIGFWLGISPVGVKLQMQESIHYFSLPEFELMIPWYLYLYGFVMPIAVTFVVNYMVIRKKLNRTALSLMRNEAKTLKVSKVQLDHLSFVRKFQIRQMIREARIAVTVVIGMFIALLCLMIGLDSMVLCEHIKEYNVRDTRFEYMYSLKYPTKEVPKGGEEAYAKVLKKAIAGYNWDVTVLGIQEDNPFFDVALKKSKQEVTISSATAQKYGVKVGDSLILNDEEAEESYAFIVADILQYSPGFYVFMDIDSARELFGARKEEYNIVFSDHDLNIETGRVYAVTTKEDIRSGAGVFVDLIKGMVGMLLGVSTLIFIVVLYLMMKTMLDRSKQNISLIRIFGYRNREVKKLYLNGNFYIILAGAVCMIPLSKYLMDLIFPFMIANINCGMDLSFSPVLYGIVFGGIVMSYVLIHCALTASLKKILPAEVLKNRE